MYGSSLKEIPNASSLQGVVQWMLQGVLCGVSKVVGQIEVVSWSARR